MTSEELQAAMKALAQAIKEYRAKEAGSRQKTSSSSTTDELIERVLNGANRDNIARTASILIKEAYMLGPAGRVCPICGGSGRV